MIATVVLHKTEKAFGAFKMFLKLLPRSGCGPGMTLFPFSPIHMKLATPWFIATQKCFLISSSVFSSVQKFKRGGFCFIPRSTPLLSETLLSHCIFLKFVKCFLVVLTYILFLLYLAKYVLIELSNHKALRALSILCWVWHISQDSPPTSLTTAVASHKLWCSPMLTKGYDVVWW